MLRHIHALNESHKEHRRQYSKFLNVLLVKYPSSNVPKIFSSRIYRKTLSTPLCFRDFNDYKKFNAPAAAVGKDKRKCNKNFLNANIHQVQDKSSNTEGFFILPSSIKSRQVKNGENDSATQQNAEQTKNSMMNHVVTERSETVYNVCNRRMEFHVEESEFQSCPLVIKASVYTWLNYEKHLNLTCDLNDTVRLSYSYDFHKKLFNSATLRDDYTGMICSINIADVSQDNNVRISFPHGLTINIIDMDTVEMSWMEGFRDGMDENVETKRTFFSNGFVMIQMLNTNLRIYSPNGTIFDVAGRKKSRVSKVKIKNEQQTVIHRLDIASIQFLKSYISLTSFQMLLPTGKTFLIENDWIVDEINTSHDVQKWRDDKEQHLYLMRDDGLRIMHTNSYTKSFFNDATVITKTYYFDDDAIATTIESDGIDDTKAISILDEIWLTETERDAKILMTNVLDFVNDDYFVRINHASRAEHKKYGCVNFHKNGTEIELFNGITIAKRFEKLTVLVNGTRFSVNEMKMEFCDEKCDGCSK